jgi:hypothetical protein
MKVVKENSENITIEMSKEDFNHLRNIFVYNKDFVTNDLDKYGFDVAEKIIHLENTDKGLFDEIETLLKHTKEK